MEDRLKFYDTGDAPKKNIDAMKEVMDELSKSAMDVSGNEDKKKKKKKKDKKSLQPDEQADVKTDVEMTPVAKNQPGEETASQKKKKKKKAKVEGLFSYRCLL